jgi:hypothetical protein
MRLQSYEIAAEIEPPPDWRPAVFARRQRRIRIVAQRHLRLAALVGRPWQSTVSVHQGAAKQFDRAELEYALATLCETEVIECKVQTERIARNRPDLIERAYWRLADAPPGVGG